MTSKELKEQLPDNQEPVLVWVEINNFWVLRECTKLDIHPHGGITIDLEQR